MKKVIFDTNNIITFLKNKNMFKIILKLHKEKKIQVFFDEIIIQEIIKELKSEKINNFEKLNNILNFNTSPSDSFITIGEYRIGSSDRFPDENFDIVYKILFSKYFKQSNSSEYFKNTNKRNPEYKVKNIQNDIKLYHHAINLECNFFITEDKNFINKKERLESIYPFCKIIKIEEFLLLLE